MKHYKIQLLSNIDHTCKQPYFLWVTNRNLTSQLENLRNGEEIYRTDDRFDKEEDLNPMMAIAWKARLTALGVECDIVEIDYSEENI